MVKQKIIEGQAIYYSNEARKNNFIIKTKPMGEKKFKWAGNKKSGKKSIVAVEWRWESVILQAKESTYGRNIFIGDIFLAKKHDFTGKKPIYR